MVSASLTLLLAACAAEPDAPRVLGYQAVSAPLVTPAAATTTVREVRYVVPPRRTMNDKVLTAIALERVTGRKPDPARLVD
jgi:hypothetical protein